MVDTNPSVVRMPAKNTRVVCAVCGVEIRSLSIPNGWVAVCLDCWERINKDL